MEGRNGKPGWHHDARRCASRHDERGCGVQLMARSGHCQPLPHGSELAAQVGYRLSGTTPDRSLSTADQERQIDYRLGDTGVDSRQVWYLGSGGTATRLGYRPGEQLTAADGQVVRDAMFGIDRATGERVRIKQERNRAARIAAAPVWDAMREAWGSTGADPEQTWTSIARRAQLRALSRAASRRNGTVAFNTVNALLQSNEAAWQQYARAIARGRHDVTPPAFRVDPAAIMRALGAHHRALHEAGQEQVFGGKPIDLTLDDPALGAAIWAQIAAEAQRMVVRGNAGYELTLTCPKSFSVAAFVDPADRQDAWMACVRDAVTGSVNALMARVGQGRTGHSGDGHQAQTIAGDGYAATVSIEAHSRELDPHLHGHVMIPNRLLCADGVERAIATGGADLVNHAWWLQAEFERHLRALSVDRGLVTGWEMDLAGRQWEVAGADPEVMDFYSQGHALVQAAVRDVLEAEPGPVSRDALRKIDSRAKRTVTGRKGDVTLTWAQIKAHAHTRATAAGIDLTTAFALAEPDPALQPGAWSDDIWARTVEEVVCEHKGAEITARIEAAIRAFAPHEWSDAMIRARMVDVVGREFTTGETFARGSVAVRRHASNRVLDAEQCAWSAYIRGLNANAHRIHPDHAAVSLDAWLDAAGWTAQGRDLTPGQRALFAQMTSGTDRVSTVVGAAGSGKTTAVDAARHALAAHGRQVYGVCVAAIASQGLQDAANVDAGTVTWLVARIDFATNPLNPARAEAERLARSPRRKDQGLARAIHRAHRLPQMDHLVIDEASMIPATDLATILEWTETHHITVTLIGDHKQLGAVGPSSMFLRLHQHNDGAELTENLRQQTDVGRECARFLRDGDVEAALFALADAGQFVVVASQTEAERVLIDAWAQRATQTSDPFERLAACGIETQRNDQVDILNAHARTIARRNGWIEPDDITYATRARRIAYARGDQCIITKNIRRKDGSVLSNGTRGLVADLGDDWLALVSCDPTGRVHTDRLTRAQIVARTRHGYAMTTHKLQGQTVRSLVVDVGPDRDLSSTYVALTRHKDDVLAVVNIADIGTGPEIERLIAAGPDARRDAVIAMTADTIAKRGFTKPVTAHEAINLPLVSRRIAVPIVGMR